MAARFLRRLGVAASCSASVASWDHVAGTVAYSYDAIRVVRERRMRRALLILCVGAMVVRAQRPVDAALDAKLRELAVEAARLEDSLPAFSCTEELTSQAIASKGGKVKMQTQATGEVRVVAAANGKMEDMFTATTMNGKPVGRAPLRVPFFVTGGFRHALSMFRAKEQVCYDFRMEGERIEFASKAQTPRGCEDKVGTTGFAQLDTSGAVAHIELNVPVDIARRREVVPSGAVDLSPVTLGDERYLLSTHVVALQPDGKTTYRFEAEYSACRKFHATVTLGAPTVVPDGDSVAQ
jgi:hypothetical protein